MSTKKYRNHKPELKITVVRRHFRIYSMKYFVDNIPCSNCDNNGNNKRNDTRKHFFPFRDNI